MHESYELPDYLKPSFFDKYFSVKNTNIVTDPITENNDSDHEKPVSDDVTA